MNIFSLSVPILIGSICLSFLPSGGGKVAGYTNYWEDENTYVYYTEEEAVFEGVCEEDEVAEFYLNGEVFGAFVWDSELQEGDIVTLVFENRESHSEYSYAEEYGIETKTRSDGRIVQIY